MTAPETTQEISYELLELSLKNHKPLTFGVVNRRSEPPDYSRQTILKPRLYSLLVKLGGERSLVFNSIAVHPGGLKEPAPPDTTVVSIPGFDIVYSTYTNKKTLPLPTPSVKNENGRYYFYRGDERMTLKRRKKNSESPASISGIQIGGEETIDFF